MKDATEALPLQITGQHNRLAPFELQVNEKHNRRLKDKRIVYKNIKKSIKKIQRTEKSLCRRNVCKEHFL